MDYKNSRLSSKSLSEDVKTLRNELKNIREELKKQCVVNRKSFTKLEELLRTSTKYISDSTDVNSETNDLAGSHFSLKPISHIRSCYKNKNGTPRQASICSFSRATLKIDPKIFTNPDHSLTGLQEFSHVWLLFVFHQNSSNCTKAKVKAPRMDGNSTGVFATRSPHRPCPIGLSLSRIEKIEGDTLHLFGVDLIDGTPVLDIKPYIPIYDTPWNNSSSILLQPDISEHGTPSEVQTQSLLLPPKGEATCSSVTVASWLNSPSKLKVLFTDRAKSQLDMFHSSNIHAISCEHCLVLLNNSSEAKIAIENILEEDPRSVYRRNKCKDRLYYFTLDNIHVTCWFDESEPLVEVVRIKPEIKCISE